MVSHLIDEISSPCPTVFLLPSSHTTLPMAYLALVTLASLLCLELPDISCLKTFTLFFFHGFHSSNIKWLTPLQALFKFHLIWNVCINLSKIASPIYHPSFITCYLQFFIFLYKIYYYFTLHSILICWCVNCLNYNLLERREFLSFVYGCTPRVWHKVRVV